MPAHISPWNDNKSKTIANTKYKTIIDVKKHNETRNTKLSMSIEQIDKLFLLMFVRQTVCKQ